MGRALEREPWSRPCHCSPHNLLCPPSLPPCASVFSSVERAGLAHPVLCSEPAAKLSSTGGGRLMTRPRLTRTRSLVHSFFHSLILSASPSPLACCLFLPPSLSPFFPSSLPLCLSLSSLPPSLPSFLFLVSECPLCANLGLGTDAPEVDLTGSLGLVGSAQD